MHIALWFLVAAVMIEALASPIRDHIAYRKERKRIDALPRIPFPTPVETPAIVINGIELGASNYRKCKSPETLVSVVGVDEDFVWYMLDDTLVVASRAMFMVDYEPRQPTRISTQ